MKGLSLKMERLKRGLSQWDLSELTGIKNYRLSLIECGRTEPTDEECHILASALDLEPGMQAADSDSISQNDKAAPSEDIGR